MKKLLFSLLALVCSVSMMAEDVTLFSFETLATTTKDGVAANSSYEFVAGTDASIYGGSATFINANSKAAGAITTGNGHTGVAFGSGNHYMKIELTEALQEDDIIEVAAYTASAAELKINNAQSAGTATSGGKLIVEKNSALDGATTIYICRNSGTTRMESMTITRPDPEAEKSDDATLSGISYNGAAVTGFDAATKTYNVTLAYGTTTKPTVTASVHEAHASIEITQPTSVTGTATIDVTAQDETTTAQYTVNFSVSSEAPSIPDGYTAFHAAQNWDNITATNALYTVNGVSTFNLAVDNTSALDCEPELSGVTKRFNFGGTGAVDGRRIELPVEGPCTITVFGGNGNAGRSITISDGANALATVCETNAGNLNTIIKESYDYTGEAGTLYLYSTTSGYYVYAVGVSAGSQKADSDLTPGTTVAGVAKDGTSNVSFTTSSTGAVSVSFEDPTIASATISGKVITITGLKGGVTTMTITQEADDNYKAGSADVMVVCNDPTAPTVVAKWDATSPVGTWTYADNSNVDASGEVKIKTNTTTVKGVKFGSALVKDGVVTNWARVTVDGGFKAGDVVSIAGAYNNSGEKVAELAICLDDATSTNDYIFNTEALINGRTAADDPEVFTYILTEDCDALNIGRGVNGATTTFMTKFEVSRPATATTITLNSEGYSTFSYDKAVRISGAKAYAGKLNETNTKLTLTEVENGLVPAGNGVVIKGEPGASVKALYAEAAPAIEENALQATTLADGSLATKVQSLVLSGATFKNFTGAAFTANKAYLDNSSNQIASLVIEFEGEETGINAVASEAKVAKAIVVAENGKLLVKKADGSVVTIAGAVVK